MNGQRRREFPEIRYLSTVGVTVWLPVFLSRQEKHVMDHLKGLASLFPGKPLRCSLLGGRVGRKVRPDVSERKTKYNLRYIWRSNSIYFPIAHTVNWRTARSILCQRNVICFDISMYFRCLILNYLDLPSVVSEVKIMDDREKCALRLSHLIASPMRFVKLLYISNRRVKIGMTREKCTTVGLCQLHVKMDSCMFEQEWSLNPGTA
jgi:hypothetical protein